MAQPIRLAVVDDSAFVRKALQRVFQSSPDVRVVGMAASGEELLESFEAWQPDAVTLDLSMPGMGGLGTLDRLMSVRRIPVIILSSHSSAEAPLTLEALSRGAADFIDKEEFSLVDFESIRTALLTKLRGVMHLEAESVEPQMAAAEEAPVTTAEMATPVPLPFVNGDLPPQLIVIGASTGGPPAIELILSQLPSAPPVPIIAVQHMPAGFTAAFAQRLDAKLPFRVREATHGGAVMPGTVYIAPGGSHVRIRSERGALTTTLGRYPETAHRPSVDILFGSVATLGLRTVAVLLTGMGDDGARGLLDLRRSGALTIAQDEATSIVYGMPRAAKDLGAVQEQLPLPSIARRLCQLTGLSPSQS